MVFGERISGREGGEHQAADDEHPPLPDAVGERSGDGRGDGRRIGQEAEEHARRDLAPSQLEDAVRRRGQELEGGEEDGEAEPAHQEEARGEERLPGRQTQQYSCGPYFLLNAAISFAVRTYNTPSAIAGVANTGAPSSLR